MRPLGIHLFTFYNTLKSSHQNVWQWKKARKTPLTHCWATVKLYTLSFHRTIRLSALPELTQGCCLPVCPVCQNQTGTRADHWSCLAWSSFLSLNHCSTLNWKQKMGDQLQTYRCPKRTQKQQKKKKNPLASYIYIYFFIFFYFKPL